MAVILSAAKNLSVSKTNPCARAVRFPHFQFSLFQFPSYSIHMPEHIEDIQHRYDELKKRMELVRSYL